MTQKILQIETESSGDFKKEIIAGVESLLQRFAQSLQGNDQDVLLTREETAKILSVSLVTLWEWTRKDIIPAYRIGTKVRYKKADVFLALQKHNQFGNTSKKRITS